MNAKKEQKLDYLNIFLGKNGARIIMIFPLLIIFFMMIFDSLGLFYSNFLAGLLQKEGIAAAVSYQQVDQQFWLLSSFKEYYVTINTTVTNVFPILMIQKIQFVVIMLSIALGVHIEPKKKLRYLSVIPLYWTYVMFQDLIACQILSIINFQVNMLGFGAILLVFSAYVGSIILLYTIFSTANLPAPVQIVPKIKRSSRKYYYVLGLSIITTAVSFFYVLVPLFNGLDYTISVTILSLILFNMFRMISYLIGYCFSTFDKPIRSRDHTPLVSVLIPAYNEEESIGRNIEAVDISASYYKGKVEVIVVDDLCTDKTREIVEEKLRNCKHLTGRIITGEGRGKSAAMNLALKEAKGELTLNLDADMITTKDTIRELVPYFIDPQVGGVGCHVEQRNEEGILRKMFSIDILYIFGLVKPGQQGFDSVMVIIGGASMYRRQVLVEIGGWGPVRTGDDGDMTLRVARYGYKIIQYKQRTVAHSQIFADLPHWFIQRTRWYMGFFYTHARNRIAIPDRQAGLRSTFQMPLVYAGSFTRFTTMLYTELIFYMAIASYLISGISSLHLVTIMLVVMNPMLIVLAALTIYYKKLKIFPYFIFWPAYSYLQMLSSFRALAIVIGNEKWETKAMAERRRSTIQT